MKSVVEGVKFEITPLSRKILDNIDILDNILTDVEREIIDIVREAPITTKELRHVYILRLIDRYKIKIPSVKEKIVLSKEELEYYQKTKEPVVLGENVRLPNLSRAYEKALKKRGFKIPAFETFDNMLMSLEKLGIVSRRYDPVKKGRWLWILNPDFLIAQKEKKS